MSVSDIELAAKVDGYMKDYPYATRNELVKKLSTSSARLRKIESAGLVNIPAALTKSAGASLGRKKNKVGKKWYIKKPAPWQIQAQA